MRAYTKIIEEINLEDQIIEQRIIPPYVMTADESVLIRVVMLNQANVYSEELERARDYLGHFIADDETTESDEAYTPRRKTVEEFTYVTEIGGKFYIQVTGGYDESSFNSRNFPITDDVIDFYLTLGEPVTNEEFKKAKESIENEIL